MLNKNFVYKCNSDIINEFKSFLLSENETVHENWEEYSKLWSNEQMISYFDNDMWLYTYIDNYIQRYGDVKIIDFDRIYKIKNILNVG